MPSTVITAPLDGAKDHERLFTALCEHIGEVNHRFLNIGHAYGAMVMVDFSGFFSSYYLAAALGVMDGEAGAVAVPQAEPQNLLIAQ